MQLRSIFVAITATLVAIVIAAPAGAQLKCKAKQNKKTGVIEYSFLNKTGGTVVYSYFDPAGFTATDDLWEVFANEATCQVGGRGKRCAVSNNPAEAAIAPPSCKIYMGDVASGDTCELYIAGCQVAQRPPPTTGYYSITYQADISVVSPIWDADTDIAWYVSPDNQARSLDDHETYLADVLNGGKSDGTDFACLTDGCNLELPTLAQLEKLAADCAMAALAIPAFIRYTGAQADVCAALWPDPSLGQPANCAWSRTVDAGAASGDAYAVCVVESGSARSSRLIAVAIIAAQANSVPNLALSFSHGETAHIDEYGTISR